MTTALLFAALATACHPVEGPRIKGSDLAAAVPAFAGVPADAEVGYAPMPGAQRTFDPPELARLAQRFGVEASSWTAVCFARPTAPLDAAAMLKAMHAALPEARVEILEFIKHPAPAGEIVFPAEGLQQPPAGRDTALWNGHVRYEGGRFLIWARVRVSVKMSRVVAAATLERGHVIAADDVKLDTAEAFPTRRRAVDKLEDVVGRAARRRIATGSMIPADALEDPCEVCKGQSVTVEVRSGAARLKLDAEAATAGRRGDTVTVRNPQTGKVFRARVLGKQSVGVDCTKGDTE